MDEAELLWKACAESLRAQLSEPIWLTSFNAAVPVDLDENRFVIAVPSTVFKERIETRFMDLLRAALGDAGVTGVDVVIEVRATGPFGDLEAAGHDTTSTNGPDGFAGPAAAMAVDTADTLTDPPAATPDDRNASVANSGINPRYTFEAFVPGPSNRFAHAAAQAVAETPARSYNPLFIYGDAGLGKTHLLQAIAHYVGENYPSFSVRYVTTESFLNQFVDTIRTGGDFTNFKTQYRDVDVLLLDDIQFIESKEALQEEFFHTFNHLHQANKQIVLSSDRPPDAFATLEDRLRSRFKWGLITEINPPDIETRLAILRKKSESERHVQPPPPEVLEFIATNVTSNIRELEGALIRVTAYASLTRETLNVELAARVLDDIIADRQPRPITPDVILDATSTMFGFPIEEIRGKSRRRPLVNARQTSMYVFRQLTDLSYPAIAREFGGRDHTTVIHAVDKVEALMQERRQVYDQVTELIRMIKAEQ